MHISVKEGHLFHRGSKWSTAPLDFGARTATGSDWVNRWAEDRTSVVEMLRGMSDLDVRWRCTWRRGCPTERSERLRPPVQTRPPWTNCRMRPSELRPVAPITPDPWHRASTRNKSAEIELLAHRAPIRYHGRRQREEGRRGQLLKNRQICGFHCTSKS